MKRVQTNRKEIEMELKKDSLLYSPPATSTYSNFNYRFGQNIKATTSNEEQRDQIWRQIFNGLWQF